MCGIAGTMALDAAPASVMQLRGMTDAVAHRTPGGEGNSVAALLGLGHWRLKRIDLSRPGHQPTASKGGLFVLNIECLRRKLLNASSALYGHLDRWVCHALMDDPLRGRGRPSPPDLIPLFLDLWIRIFLFGETPATQT